MSRPTQEKIREAFDAINRILQHLEVARGAIIELHDKTKDVNDVEYMVEHQHRWSEPSDDRNEVLFARLQTTKESLTRLYDDKVTEGIHAYLDHIIKEAEDAKKVL
jgi:hypothetical protein